MNKNNDHFPKKSRINYMKKKKSAIKESFYKKKNPVLFEGITKLKFAADSE